MACRLSDLLVRFGFGAAISAVAGLVSVFAGSEPGGILLAFPAILPATLTLIEKEESERQAEDLDVGSILGAAALAAFAIVVWQYMDGGNPPVVLALATARLASYGNAFSTWDCVSLSCDKARSTRAIAQLRASQHP